AGAGWLWYMAPAAPVPDEPPALAVPGSGRTDLLGDALPPGAVARLGTVRFRHGDWDKMIAWSPDGKQVVSAQQGTIRFWDPASGQLAAQIESADPVCRAFAFTPDGKQVVSAGHLKDDWRQRVTRFWDAETRQEVRTVKWVEPRGLQQG